MLAISAVAVYEEPAEPARMLGMGSVIAGVGDDVSVAIFNPAIAAGIKNYALSGTYSSRWNLQGFREYEAGITLPFRFGTFSGWWQERSITDVYGERTASFGFARKIISKLDGGLNAKLFMTSAEGAEIWSDPAYEGTKYAVAFDVGLLYKPDQNWRLGGVARNINQPEIKILSTTETGDKVGLQLALGGSWEVAEDLILATDFVSNEGNLNKWQMRTGMEITFFKTLSVRAGAKGERLSLGTGLKGDRWAFDAALANHRWLGNIYRFTVTVKY